VLIPLSIVFIRYFPELGRRYSIHSGELEITGVTTQKNSLGAMIVVCGLIFLWDWLENSRPGATPRTRNARLLTLGLALAAGWLLWQSDSKTSLTCVIVGGLLITAVRLPLLHRRISAMGPAFLVLGVACYFLDLSFGFSTALVSSLGRDMTFTGRTEVWHALLGLHIDPLFGTGFMSLWDDPQLRGRLPEWVAGSAHNGYLEIYLAGGIVGVAFLALMLLVTGLRLNQALRAGGGHFAVVRFAIFLAALIANFSESNFASMTPLGVLFLISAIGDVPLEQTLPLAETSYHSAPSDADARFFREPDRATRSLLLR
jgi:exopolysaccharide production protein ExoQ